MGFQSERVLSRSFSHADIWIEMSFSLRAKFRNTQSRFPMKESNTVRELKEAISVGVISIHSICRSLYLFQQNNSAFLVIGKKLRMMI